MTDFKGKIRTKESAKNVKLLLNYALPKIEITNLKKIIYIDILRTSAGFHSLGIKTTF